MVRINNDWDEILKEEFNSDYYNELRNFLIKEYKEKKVFPNMHDIFNALKMTSFKDTKVVILGQDPYHGEGQAHGLCFSVQDGVRIPPSLLNIYKEIKAEYGYDIPRSGNLTSWAKQGVLMLNTILTVRQGSPMSHKEKGWEKLTDSIIRKLNERETPVVFILWGAPSQKKEYMITNKRHLVLKSPHPSPLSASRGFFGNNHFTIANEFLKKNGIKEIDWRVL